MKPLDKQLDQLLHAAAQAPRTPGPDIPTPSATWLLQQRENAASHYYEDTIRPTLRIALATACLILAITSVVTTRQITHNNQDVLTTSERSLTQMLAR